MQFSDNEMSAILLCSYIGINKNDDVKPFSTGEWNTFLDRIIDMKLEPGVILNEENELFNQLGYEANERERIKKLVSRGGAVALELDSLMNKGIQIVTLFNKNYPILLKQKLERKTPQVLFYSGDIELAKKMGIAVVGSRNVDEAGIDFTKKLVAKATAEKLIVYSGGARGVDSISENTAIENNGGVVSFIADSLSTKIKKKDVVTNLINKRLLLISDVKPEMGFSVARAMNRNKYIYISAYCGAFVVSSDYNKGGTWAGAIENIRHNWTKTFVWNHKEYMGNSGLIEKGGIPYEISEKKISDLMKSTGNTISREIKREDSYEQMDIFRLDTMAVGESANNTYR